ncbi:MAG: hypothetical protein EHM87_25465, partial [Burkholderiales bacterium]
MKNKLHKNPILLLFGLYFLVSDLSAQMIKLLPDITQSVSNFGQFVDVSDGKILVSEKYVKNNTNIYTKFYKKESGNIQLLQMIPETYVDFNLDGTESANDFIFPSMEKKLLLYLD